MAGPGHGSVICTTQQINIENRGRRHGEAKNLNQEQLSLIPLSLARQTPQSAGTRGVVQSLFLQTKDFENHRP